MATSTGAPALAAELPRSASRDWRGADESCQITFSSQTLEQMRFESSRAMNGPGGQGVGGLLLGTRLGSSFRIVGFQPIPCEHALGPDFRLSAREESGLSSLLDELKAGPESQDAQVVGWFVSHPRSDLQLSGRERQFHEKFFAGGWLALVGKPDRLGEMELAVHHAQDGCGSGACMVEPVLSITPDASPRPPRKSALARRRRTDVPMPAAQAVEPVEPSISAVAPAATSWRRRNLTASAALILLFGALCGLFSWNWQRTGGAARTVSAQTPIEIDPLSLHAYEDRGRFYISWNGKAETLRRARQVLLLIQDGDQRTRYELSKAKTASGVQVYRRVNSEVKVTLEVHGAKGDIVEESTHYTTSEFTTPTVLRITPDTVPAEIYDPAGGSLGLGK